MQIHKNDIYFVFFLQRWETCSAAGVKVKLPQDLCEHASIFKALMNYPKVWQESLTSIQRESLMGLLPKFPKDCDVNAELDKTLQMLFRGENHRSLFKNPQLPIYSN